MSQSFPLEPTPEDLLRRDYQSRLNDMSDSDVLDQVLSAARQNHYGSHDLMLSMARDEV